MTKTKKVFIIGGIVCCICMFIIIHDLDSITGPACDLTHIRGVYYCYEEDTHNSEIISDINYRKNVPPTVLKYKTHGRYIIVKQKPSMPQDVITGVFDYPNFSDDSLYYWIIDINCDSVIGPLEYASFSEECKLRNISDSILLQLTHQDELILQ